MLAATITLFHLLGALSSIHAIMRARTAQGSIAWAVSLNTIPYLTVPAYWLLGRSRFRGYVVARRQADPHSAEIKDALNATVERFRVDETHHPQASLAAQRLASMPSLTGNRVDLLIDGEATFESIFQGIENAERYVLVQFYTVHDDGLGGRLQDLLLKKAGEGLRVYFLYDEIGSHALSRRYLDELRDGGVEAHAFNSRRGPSHRFQLNFRNHRKIVVVDGRIAWLGGHNVGDEYLGLDPEFGDWRDTHLRIEGPAALEAQVAFAEDWHWATEETPDLDWNGEAARDGSDSRVLVIPTGPADELETASLMFVHAINSARERIWIASPYFVPDAAVLAALQLAGLRGVEVRILIPEMPDHLLVYLAAHSYFEDACRTGVELSRYVAGFLHQKTLLIDHEVAAVGTANFDNRSFRLNFEITAFVSDRAFAQEVEAMFERDFERSEKIPEDALASRPWWFRLAVRCARLVAPIL